MPEIDARLLRTGDPSLDWCVPPGKLTTKANGERAYMLSHKEVSSAALCFRSKAETVDDKYDALTRAVIEQKRLWEAERVRLLLSQQKTLGVAP